MRLPPGGGGFLTTYDDGGVVSVTGDALAWQLKPARKRVDGAIAIILNRGQPSGPAYGFVGTTEG